MATTAQKEAAALCMEHLVDHDWHGYDWGDRWGDGEGVCHVETPIGTCEVEQGDRDCSSSEISAYEAAGISCGGATYTGNMEECMVASGNFRAHRMSDGYNCDDGYVAKRGDCYVNTADHTAFSLCDDPDTVGEFCINEFGGVYGGQVGDQTGGESKRGPFYGFPWNICLECLVDDEGEPEAVMRAARSEARGIQLYPSNGTDAQKWRKKWVDKTWFVLENVACGKVLDVTGNLSEPGTAVIVYPENGGTNQMWRYERREGEADVHIVPRVAPDKCLDCVGGGHVQGTGIIIWNQHDGANQDWIEFDNRDGTVTLINNSLGEKLALDVVNGGA